MSARARAAAGSGSAAGPAGPAGVGQAAGSEAARRGLWQALGAWRPWRALAAVALLTAATIAWAALPLSGGSAGTWIAMVVAVAGGVAGLGALVVGDAEIGSGAFDPLLVRLAGDAARALRAVPWPEAMIVAVLVLEVLHPARPWHTGVLGLALLALLLAAHLAESGSGPRAALGPQAPVLAAGIGLGALAVAAVALPPLPAGPAATALRILAVAAAVLAGALALPVRRS